MLYNTFVVSRRLAIWNTSKSCHLKRMTFTSGFVKSCNQMLCGLESNIMAYKMLKHQKNIYLVCTKLGWKELFNFFQNPINLQGISYLWRQLLLQILRPLWLQTEENSDSMLSCQDSIWPYLRLQPHQDSQRQLGTHPGRGWPSGGNCQGLEGCPRRWLFWSQGQVSHRFYEGCFHNCLMIFPHLQYIL